MKSFSLEGFKNLLKKDDSFKDRLTDRSDIVDTDNGSMLIYSEHLDKWLEKYSCKDIEDLQDTLWFNYGIFVKVLD